MIPQQADSGGTVRLQLGDGRWTTLRLEPEEWQLYYGGARRDKASELAERAELAKLIGLQPGPAGPIRDPKSKEDGEAATRTYLQGAHLYVGMEEAREAAADEPDKFKVELDDLPGSAAGPAVRPQRLSATVSMRAHPTAPNRSASMPKNFCDAPAPQRWIAHRKSAQRV